MKVILINNLCHHLQVGRAFSFNKTPSKLKRAVSTVISPLTSSAKVNRSQHLGTLGGHLGTPGDSVTELRPEVLLFFTLPSLASLTSLPHFLLLMVVVMKHS